MRVLHVSSGNMFGGIETLLVTLARYRACAPDMEPEFALAFEGRVSRELREAGVAVHVLGAVRASRPWTVWRARRALRAVLKARRFDVVVCHAPWPHAIFGPVVKRARRPLVFWMHAPADSRHWIERWAARTQPDRVIANSHFTASVPHLIFSDAPTAVLYCPVAVESPRFDLDRQPAPTLGGIAPGSVVVLMVSRLESGKGHEVLLRALQQIRPTCSWTCVILGSAQTEAEATYRQRLLDLVASLGLDSNVRFVEDLPSVDFAYRMADVFCQPNVRPDSFGITLVESMLHGLPIITSAIGGPDEFLDATCAITVPPGDVHRLAAAITTLIDSPQDRTRMGAAGQSRARDLCDPIQQVPKIATELRRTVAVTR